MASFPSHLYFWRPEPQRQRRRRGRKQEAKEKSQIPAKKALFYKKSTGIFNAERNLTISQVLKNVGIRPKLPFHRLLPLSTLFRTGTLWQGEGRREKGGEEGARGEFLLCHSCYLPPPSLSCLATGGGRRRGGRRRGGKNWPTGHRRHSPSCGGGEKSLRMTQLADVKNCAGERLSVSPHT